MADQATDTGFRFSKVMAWAPAILLVLALVFIVRGDMLVGVLVAVAALIFWLVVRRRKSPAAPGAPPPA